MSKRILIIERDNAIREIISLVLAEEGYQVIAVSHHSLNTLHALNPHLILLDEWLPDLKQGHLVCLELKAIHELLHVPVIILSTAADIEEIACACKADGFVRKPFDIDELLLEVKKCCLTVI